jgi:hypothetical protein
VGVACAGIGFANCGGGERPPPAADDPVEAGPGGNQEGGNSSDLVTFSPPLTAAGILFGEEGLVNCGTQAPEKILTLKNPRPTDVISFTAKLTAGDKFFKINPKEGGIPAKGQAAIQIIAEPIPQESDVAPDLYAGTLEVTTSDGQPPVIIRLHQTARGAIITSTIVNHDVDFGDVKVQTDGTQPFNIQNSGNVEVTANWSLGTQVFKIDASQTATAKLGPGATVAKTLTLKPADVVEYTDTLALTFNTSAVHCRPPPEAATLKGKGTTSVGVSPGTLPFGLVDCLGPAALFQPVTISSTAAMTFTPVLEKGITGTSPYTLTDTAGTNIPTGVGVPMTANSTFMIRVVPKPIPRPSTTALNGFADKLIITTTAPGDAPHNVQLNMTARGAILVMTPDKIEHTVANTELGQTFADTFSIVNNGNLQANYSVSVAEVPGQTSNPPDGTFTLNGGATTLTGSVLNGTPFDGLLNQKAPLTLNTQYLADIDLQAPGAVLCGDLPPKMRVFIRTPAQ